MLIEPEGRTTTAGVSELTKRITTEEYLQTCRVIFENCRVVFPRLKVEIPNQPTSKLDVLLYGPRQAMVLHEEYDVSDTSSEGEIDDFEGRKQGRGQSLGPGKGRSQG